MVRVFPSPSTPPPEPPESPPQAARAREAEPAAPAARACRRVIMGDSFVDSHAAPGPQAVPWGGAHCVVDWRRKYHATGRRNGPHRPRRAYYTTALQNNTPRPAHLVDPRFSRHDRPGRPAHTGWTGQRRPTNAHRENAGRRTHTGRMPADERTPGGRRPTDGRTQPTGREGAMPGPGPSARPPALRWSAAQPLSCSRALRSLGEHSLRGLLRRVQRLEVDRLLVGVEIDHGQRAVAEVADLQP